MSEQDSYQSWLEKKRNFDVSQGFSKNVLDQIQRELRAGHRKNKGRWTDRWLEWISLHPLAQSATISAAAAAGVARLILILQIVLSL